jgi:hypothetical protein
LSCQGYGFEGYVPVVRRSQAGHRPIDSENLNAASDQQHDQVAMSNISDSIRPKKRRRSDGGQLRLLVSSLSLNATLPTGLIGVETQRRHQPPSDDPSSAVSDTEDIVIAKKRKKRDGTVHLAKTENHLKEGKNKSSVKQTSGKDVDDKSRRKNKTNDPDPKDRPQKRKVIEDMTNPNNDSSLTDQARKGVLCQFSLIGISSTQGP